MTPADRQATFCATVVDEWWRRGLRHAVIAPGSRSTPLALALAERDDMRVHVVHDERVAAFVALGLGLQLQSPVVLLCTSGTATANFLPAVVEAGLSDVPMLVVTADRPARLRGVGAAQTIDQVALYGTHVRWFRDVASAGSVGFPVDDEWRVGAGEAFAEAASGPAHLNLQFDEPLLGTAGALPDPWLVDGIASRSSEMEAGDSAPAGTFDGDGVILAGGGSGVATADVLALARATGWPIIADPLSGLRPWAGVDGALVVTAADAILRHRGFAAGHVPDAVIRIGRPAASKVLATWVDAAGATIVQVGGPGVVDPGLNVAASCSIETLLAAAEQAPGSAESASGSWARRWAAAESLAADTILSLLTASSELSEPMVARTVADHLPPGAVLTVASSMPVRDLEWFGGPSAVAASNRGANGIDGVLSTGLGRALAGATSVVLMGDLAFVHDANALVALRSRRADLRVVVVDNDGGGIFSFLPQAVALRAERFEQLFGTPLGTDVVALAEAHGVRAGTIEDVESLRVQLLQPGPWVVRVPSTRTRNVVVHDWLHAAVAKALDTRF